MLFKNYSFPKEAGYRFNPSDKPRYLLFEMHYDNPELKSDIIDNSGVRLYYTEKLRTHDLGVLELGIQGVPLALHIPPKSSKIMYEATCYSKCTEVCFLKCSYLIALLFYFFFVLQ